MTQASSVTSKDETIPSSAIKVDLSPITQNFRLIWLDASSESKTRDSINTITRLQKIVDNIKTFPAINPFVDFLKKICDERIILIVSGSFSENVIPLVHDLEQLDSIFIYCGNRTRYEPLKAKWSKVKHVQTDIGVICKSLYQIIC